MRIGLGECDTQSQSEVQGQIEVDNECWGGNRENG
jgi:hypothetical protein